MDMRSLIPLVQRPSHYLGAETGAVVKTPATHPQVRARVALAFPDLYEVGMSYLGQKLLYGIVNEDERFAAERVFMPAADMAEQMKTHDVPLSTLETGTPLADMDVLAFHVTHELCYADVVHMLQLAGLPLRSADRADRPDRAGGPLVVAGGGCAYNAEPLAPFVDALALGDGEVILPALLEAVAEGKDAGEDRQNMLARVAAVPGMYVPAVHAPEGTDPATWQRVERAVVKDLDTVTWPAEMVIPFGGAVHDRLAMEIARGCTRGCRFCHAGVVYRPVRERSVSVIDEALTRGLDATGYEEFTFLSLSTGDFSALEGLFEASFERCAAEQVSISMPSLRVGSVSSALMERIASVRRTGATLAPEAATDRLRRVINKDISEEMLFDHVGRLFEHGWQSIKLYFMIGLPTETDEDVEAIFSLCQRLQQYGREFGIPRLGVTAAISPFVPKPHTPFQWEEQIGLAQVERKVALLRERFYSAKNLKLRWHEPKVSFLEGVFSRAGRELAPAVELAARRGLILSSWRDHFDFDGWMAVLEETGIDPAAMLAARPLDARLPWAHIHTGVNTWFLLRERERALTEAAITKDCRYNRCAGCGVCGDEVGIRLNRATSDQSASPAPDPDALRQRLFAEREAHREAQKAAGTPQRGPKGGKKKTPPKAPPISEELTRKAAHYRIHFTKQGPSAWLSTLEVQAAFERALRRARVHPTFSAGFHPTPRISLPRALPVGVASADEYLTLYTREAFEPEEITARLAGTLPAGMTVTQVVPLAMERKGQPECVAETYEADFATLDEQAWAEVAERFGEFANATTFPVEKATKKRTRTIDLRGFVTTVEVDPATRMVRLVCDWRDDYVNPLFLVRHVSGLHRPGAFGLAKLECQLA